MATQKELSSGLTAERLRERLSYEADTGLFRWLVKPSDRYPAGMLAGTANAAGYIQINVDGRLYYAHRLAWLYVTGLWPSDRIDHRDRNKANNKFYNLREATHGNNTTNRIIPKRSGLPRGVTKISGSYHARIKHNKKLIYIGCFHTPEEAHLAFLDAARQIGRYPFIPASG